MPPKVKAVFSDEKNPRGIPKAPFIVRRFDLLVCQFLTLVKKTDVEEYIGGADADVEAILKSFQDALAYVFFLVLISV